MEKSFNTENLHCSESFNTTNVIPKMSKTVKFKQLKQQENLMKQNSLMDINLPIALESLSIEILSNLNLNIAKQRALIRNISTKTVQNPLKYTTHPLSSSLRFKQSNSSISINKFKELENKTRKTSSTIRVNFDEKDSIYNIDSLKHFNPRIQVEKNICKKSSEDSLISQEYFDKNSVLDRINTKRVSFKPIKELTTEDESTRKDSNESTFKIFSTSTIRRKSQNSNKKFITSKFCSSQEMKEVESSKVECIDNEVADEDKNTNNNILIIKAAEEINSKFLPENIINCPNEDSDYGSEISDSSEMGNITITKAKESSSSVKTLADYHTNNKDYFINVNNNINNYSSRDNEDTLVNFDSLSNEVISFWYNNSNEEEYNKYVIENLKVVLKLQPFFHSEKYSKLVEKTLSDITCNKERLLKCLNFDLLKEALPNKLDTLILDIDETLIHSELLKEEDFLRLQSESISEEEYNNLVRSLGYDSLIDNRLIGVIVRPGLFNFLQSLTSKYNLAVFSAGSRDYVENVLNSLKIKSMFYLILCGEETINIGKAFFIKDVSLVNEMDRQWNIEYTENKLEVKDREFILIDNNIFSFAKDISNGILISSFYNNKYDEALPDLKDFIEDLKVIKESDVSRRENTLSNQIENHFCFQSLMNVFSEQGINNNL